MCQPIRSQYLPGLDACEDDDEDVEEHDDGVPGQHQRLVHIKLVEGATVSQILHLKTKVYRAHRRGAGRGEARLPPSACSSPPGHFESICSLIVKQ